MRRLCIFPLWTTALLLAALVAAPPLHAATEEADTLWWTVGDAQLADLRGGFDVGTGLIVSFGVSRAVYINNQLVTQTTLQLPDLSRLNACQVADLTKQIQSQISSQLASKGQVIQNGPGNTVSPGAIVVPLGSYIQNTLNNQTIRTETLIEATTNGLGMLKSMNLQATIRDAVSQAVGQR